jgi:peroxiredoxin
MATESNMLALGTVAPPFTLPEPATGARVSLDEFAGPALVITFIYLVPNDRQPRGS